MSQALTGRSATRPPSPSGSTWLRLALYTLGVALLACALTAIWRDRALLESALASARGAPRWMPATLVALPLISWACTSLLFLVLTRRYGRVRASEMLVLIGAAWLLNYLPLRPGMVGRVAYHKAVNHIAIRDSARVVIQAVVCTAIAAFLLAAAAGVSGNGTDAWPLLLPLLVLLPLALVARARYTDPWSPARLPRAAALLLAIAIRYVDMTLWAARYWLAFSIIGSPLPFAQAALVAAVAQVAMAAPVALGVREWVVGLFSAVTVVGLAADVLNRAAEIAGAIPVGLASIAWLAAKARQRAATPATLPLPPPT